MTTFTPSQLTQSILNALIIRTFNAFATQINQPELDAETGEPANDFIPEYDYGYFENSSFIWSPGLEPIATLTINVEIPGTHELVSLHWNEKLEEELEVKANIPFNAEENLTFFVLLEQMVYNTLYKHSLEKLDIIDVSKYIPTIQQND